MRENNKLCTVKDVLEWIDKDISEHREEWPKGKNKFVDGAMTALGNLRSFIEIPSKDSQEGERVPENGWIEMQSRPLTQEDGEVVAFHPSWIDEDFNKKGIRCGFIGGELTFISAKWNDYQDTYDNDETEMPTHYFIVPANRANKDAGYPPPEGYISTGTESPGTHWGKGSGSEAYFNTPIPDPISLQKGKAVYRWVKADLSQEWDGNDYTTEVIVKISGMPYTYDVTKPSTILYFLKEGREIYFLQEEQTNDHDK